MWSVDPVPESKLSAFYLQVINIQTALFDKDFMQQIHMLLYVSLTWPESSQLEADV